MRTVNLAIPHGWEELTPRQLLFVSSLFFQGLTRQAFLAKAFISLCGLKVLPGRYGSPENPIYLFRQHDGRAFPLSAGELQSFCGSCGFLLGERLGFNPLPRMAGRKARNLMMYDACFGEFIAALVYYNQFRDPERDRVLLNKLCAVMYPSGAWDPDNLRHTEFARLPLHVCYTAFLWFGMVLNGVAHECPDLFRTSADDSEPVSMRENIHAMYSLVTEGDLTKEKEVAAMDMWRVLYGMEEKARALKEINDRL